jgi:hypothetical protein
VHKCKSYSNIKALAQRGKILTTMVKMGTQGSTSAIVTESLVNLASCITFVIPQFLPGQNVADKEDDNNNTPTLEGCDKHEVILKKHLTMMS